MVYLNENIKTVGVYAHPIVVRFVQASEFHYEAGEVVPSHKHQITEIHFVVEGKVKTYVGKKRYFARDNWLYFIRAGDTHYQYTVAKTKMYHLVFFITNIKAEGICKSDSNYVEKKDIGLIKKIAKYPSVVFCAPKSIIDSLNEIYRSFKLKNEDGTKIPRLLGKFLVQLSKLLGDYTSYKELKAINLDKFDYRTRKTFNKLIKYIKTNYNKSISLRWMASELNFSNRHFERVFKQILGCTPTDYLMKIRIQKALKLLKNPKAKVENIIKDMGFNNCGRFYKYFKKYVGITPGDYKSYSTENKEIITDLFKQE